MNAEDQLVILIAICVIGMIAVYIFRQKQRTNTIQQKSEKRIPTCVAGGEHMKYLATQTITIKKHYVIRYYTKEGTSDCILRCPFYNGRFDEATIGSIRCYMCPDREHDDELQQQGYIVCSNSGFRNYEKARVLKN
jgi:hypothetical protein